MLATGAVAVPLFVVPAVPADLAFSDAFDDFFESPAAAPSLPFLPFFFLSYISCQHQISAHPRAQTHLLPPPNRPETVKEPHIFK